MESAAPEEVRQHSNSPFRRRFLTPELSLDPLRNRARRLHGLLRSVSHLMILPAGDPRAVLLAPAIRFHFAFAIPPIPRAHAHDAPSSSFSRPERFDLCQFESASVAWRFGVAFERKKPASIGVKAPYPRLRRARLRAKEPNPALLI